MWRVARLPQPLRLPRRHRSEGPGARTRRRAAARRTTTRDYWTGWEARATRRRSSSASDQAARPRRRRRQEGAAEEEPGPGRGAPTTSSLRRTRTPTTATPIHAEDRSQAPSPATSPRSGGRSATTTSTRSTRRAAPTTATAPRRAYRQSIKFKKPPVYGVVDVQARLDVLQAAALRDRASASSSTCSATPTSRRRRRAIPAPTSAPRRTRTSPARSPTSTSPDPRADDPYIPRNDVLDTEPDPRRGRAEDAHRHRPRAGPEAHPPEREVVGRDLQGALAGVPGAQPVSATPIEVSELILKKWPMHRDAPVIQNQIADIYDTAHAPQSREGPPERDGERGQGARGAYASSLPTSARRAWVEREQGRSGGAPGRRSAWCAASPGGRRPTTHKRRAARSCSQAIGIGDKASRDRDLFERALSEAQAGRAQGWARLPRAGRERPGRVREQVLAGATPTTRSW